MTNILLLSLSLIYSLLVIFVFFTKKRAELYENKIYISIIISNLLGIVLEIFCIIFAIFDFSNISNLVVRSYMLYLFIFGGLLTLYISIISCKNSKDYKKITLKFLASFFVFGIVLFFLPMQFYSKNQSYYSQGMCVNYLVFVSIIYIFLDIVLILKNYRTIKSKKILPVIMYIFLMSIVIIIQRIFPELSLITCFETFLVILMYFTIENPDMKLIAQLNEAKAQAEKANNAKSDFLSSMSHEIRTPLNAIVGFSQALSEEDINDSAKEEVKDIILASETLLDLVNGILDISKIEANKLEIINKEYSFKKVFDELVVLTKGRLGEKPLEFNYHYDESIPEVLYGDHVRIKQVILNLLTNSVKYTRQGKIDFTVSSVKRDGVCRLIVSVEDTGIGIKKENIDKLFTKFERFDEKNTTIEGTGLGLAITKQLVELMNGNIVVQSVYNSGSKFTVALDQKIVEGKIIESETINNNLLEFDASDKKILIVDDNNLNLKVATRLLKNYNCNIQTVTSGIECLDLINSNNSFDLILMDDMMPRMSGSETFARLKKIESFNIPVVALTANAISGMKEKYLAEGFDDYLAKPIEKPELNRVMIKFLKKD